MAEQQQPIHMDVALEKYTAEDATSVGLPSPGAMNLLRLFSKQMLDVPFFAKKFWGNASTMFALTLIGREMGLTPMESLIGFFLDVNGQPRMYADCMLSVMRKHQFKFEWLRSAEDGCELKGVRSDGDSYTGRFTVEDANRAGLLDGPSSINKQYPRDWYECRAIARVFRRLGSDFGGSQMYAEGEIPEVVAEPPNAVRPEQQEQPSRFAVGKKVAPVTTEPPPESIPEQEQNEDPLSKSGQEDTAQMQRLDDPTTPIVTPSSPPEPEQRQAAPDSPPPPTVAPITTVQPSIADRIKAAIKSLGDDRRAQTIINAYFRAWFDSPKLPVSPGEYAEAMDDLEGAIKSQEELLRSKPQEIGASAGAKRRKSSLFEGYNWSDATKLAARDVMGVRKYKPEDFNAWAKAVGLDKMNEDDAMAFLTVSQYTRLSHRLVDISSATGQTIATCVSMVKKALRTKEGKILTDQDFEEAFASLEPKIEDPPEGMLPFVE